MSEHTKFPELAVGYMDQGLGHGHYAVIVAETNELLDVLDQNKDRLDFIVRACNRDKDLQTLLEDALDWIEGVVEIYPEAFSTEIVDELKAAIAKGKPEQETH